MNPFLLDLHVRLAEGLVLFPEEFRLRHAAYLQGCQNADGGFSGREGGSDLYYTGFALRGLAILDTLTLDVCERAGRYLKDCLTRQASVVDLYSLLYGCLLVQAGGGPDVLAQSVPDWPERLAQVLESFRTPDHGYGRAPGAASGSTYHTFLIGLCYQLLGKDWPNPDTLVQFVRSRKREDGGYVEVGAARRSGTNPTAAAIGILQLIQGNDLDLEETRPAVDYLVEAADSEGGLRANDRVPLADLLSTFTGLWTLAQLKALDQIDQKRTRRFVLALELPQGGFHAGFWDEGFDVEYTFYGLGTLGLLANL